MSHYKELRQYWQGLTDAQIAETAGRTVEDVRREREGQLAALTDKALENIVAAAMTGDVQASIWLDQRGLIELPRAGKA